MSTRCQILFRSEDGTENGGVSYEEAQIYQHSDGYPEGVLPELLEFYKWNVGENFDVPSSAANFIYYEKRKMESYDSGEGKRFNFKTPKTDSFVRMEFGIEKTNHEIHGDEEYLYRITISDNSNWVVEIADVEDEDTTFDNANYKIKGDLQEVEEKIERIQK